MFARHPDTWVRAVANQLAEWLGRGVELDSASALLRRVLVRDGCSRRVIGWVIDEHMHTDLVQAALAMAVAMRGEFADEVILHANRGCQYTSAQLARFAREHNLVRSVGRTAVCWDNTEAESFWATLKVEFYDSLKRDHIRAVLDRSPSA